MNNNTVTSDFMRVLLALKSNTLKDCNVADVYIVSSITNDGYYCTNVSNKNIKLTAIALQGLEIVAGDVVLVIFTNSDFRQNLKRYKQGSIITENKDIEIIHSTAFGIIVGIVYHKEET